MKQKSRLFFFPCCYFSEKQNKKYWAGLGFVLWGLIAFAVAAFSCDWQVAHSLMLLQRGGTLFVLKIDSIHLNVKRIMHMDKS